MKRKICYTLLILLIFIFPDFSIAEQVIPKTLSTDTISPGHTMEVQCNKPGNSTVDKKKKDKNKGVKVSEIVKKKVDYQKYEETRYCRPVLKFWCDKICIDASQSIPHCSSQKKRNLWGKRCTPRLMAKCQQCGWY